MTEQETLDTPAETSDESEDAPNIDALPAVLETHGEILPMPEALAEAAAIAKREEAYLQALQSRERILAQALASSTLRTTARQWTDYQGDTDPRPTYKAAMAYFATTGAHCSFLPVGPKTEQHPGGQPWVEVDSGGRTEVMVTLQVTAIGRIVTADGSRLVEDPFLGAGRRGVDGRARFTDALKAAQANAMVRAALALGATAVTWEMLEAAGIKRADVPKVVFAESGAAAGKKAMRAMAGQKCPKCGKALVLRDGRNGAFIACTGFKGKGKGCQFTAQPQEADDTPEQTPPTPPDAEPAAPGPKKADEDAPGEAVVDETGDTSSGSTDAAPADSESTPEPAGEEADPWDDPEPAVKPDVEDDFDERSDEELISMVGLDLRSKFKGKAAPASVWMKKQFDVARVKELKRDDLLRAIRHLQMGKPL